MATKSDSSESSDSTNSDEQNTVGSADGDVTADTASGGAPEE